MEAAISRALLQPLTVALAYYLIRLIKAQKDAQEDIQSIWADLTSMEAVLYEIEAASPADQLDDDMKLHYDEAIRLTYSIKQCVNKLMASGLVDAAIRTTINNVNQAIGDMILLSKFSSEINTLKNEIKKLREWFDDHQVAILAAVGHLGHTMDVQVKDDIVKKLTSKGKLNIASIHGPTGVGKTTVAAQVYTELKPRFEITAWVTVPTNPDIQEILRSILRQIGQKDHVSNDQEQMIQAIREALENKRYFLVIDNICIMEAWDIIKSALTQHYHGSAVLTTTCTADIASYVGGGHILETLNDDYSIKLFNQKLFGSQENYPPELKDISREIVCTCGGNPLAIIIAAGLLAVKPPKEEDWRSVLDFIQARRFFDSYTHLSPNIRSSLLYLSLFQKGYEISVDRLIWGWIAEGFISKHDEITWQEKGEEYLTELMEKKFIEAVEVDAVGKALSCRVQDRMHEVLVACAAQQNFATILDGRQEISMPASVNHRLSIQGNKATPLLREDTLFCVKSLVVSGDGNLRPSLLNFKGLQVFEFGGCDSLQDLRGIGSLSRLRCLVLGSNISSKILKEIGNLVLLQTLDLRATDVKELPQSVFQISQLRRLCVNSRTRIPDGIGKMGNLEELGDINISKPELLKRLCNLTKLRVLRIAVWSSDERYGNQLLKYLCSLLKKPKNERKSPRQAIQSLSILTCCSVHFWDKSYDRLSSKKRSYNRPTPIDISLPKLEIRHSKFHSLPKWIRSVHELSSLSIEVYKVSQEIIDMLGQLQHLESLSLTSASKRSPDPEGRFRNSPGAFGKLTSFRIVSNAMGEIFEQGAMAELRRFTLSFEASRTKHFHFGLENLPSSVQHVRVEIICSSASARMVEEAEALIGEAIKGSGNPKAIVENRRILNEHMVEEDEVEQIAKESPDESSISARPDTCIRPNANKTDEVRSQITQLMIDNIHHQLKLLNHDAKVKDILRDTGLNKDEAHQLVQEARERVKDMVNQVLEVECGPSDEPAIVERLYNLGKSDGQHKQHLPAGGNVRHVEGPGAAEAHETSCLSTTVVQTLSAKGTPTPGKAMAAENVQDAQATVKDKAVNKLICINEAQAKVPRCPLAVTIGEPPSSSISVQPSPVGSADQSPPRFGFNANTIGMENIDQGVKEKELPASEPKTHKLEEVIAKGTETMQIEEGITNDEDTNPDATKENIDQGVQEHASPAMKPENHEVRQEAIRHVTEPMRRHNKPKKAQDYVVSPQDYECTKDDLSIIEMIKSEPNEEKRLVRIRGASIYKHQLLPLLETEDFIADEVINAYIPCISATEHLQVRSGGSVFLENASISDMIKTGKNNDTDATESLLKGVKKYLEYDMIFIPINMKDHHWYLCVINLRKRCVQVLDSLGNKKDRTDLNATLKRLEYLFKLASQRTDLNITTWRKEEVFKSKLQTDGTSCGLWMLNFMEYFTGDCLTDTPEQVNMTAFRQKIAVILYDSELNSEEAIAARGTV